MTKTKAAKKRARKAAAERKRKKQPTVIQKEQKKTRDREQKRRIREADRADRAEWDDWIIVETKDVPVVLTIQGWEALRVAQNKRIRLKNYPYTAVDEDRLSRWRRKYPTPKIVLDPKSPELILGGWVFGCPPSMQKDGLPNGARVATYPLPQVNLVPGSVLEFNNTVIQLGEQRIMPTINNWYYYVHHSTGGFAEMRGEIHGDPRYSDGEKIRFKTDKPYVLKFGEHITNFRKKLDVGML